jgi:hypothetical protein
MLRLLSLLLFAAAVALLPMGCNEGPRRYDVSGKVTFKGAPLPAGEIYFDPDSKQNNQGPQGYARIKDGVYNTAEGGKGTVGGPHVVRIGGYDGQPRNEMPLGQPLFPSFQKEVDLPRASGTMDFDVPVPVSN